MPRSKQLLVELMLLAAIGLVLGVLGPFGTYEMPAALRLLYWVSFGFIGYLFFRPVTFIAEWLSEASSVPIWLSITIAAAVAAFPLTILIGIAMGGFRFAGNPMLGTYFGPLYLQCAGIGIGIFLLMRAIFGRHRRTAPRQAESSDADDTRKMMINPPLSPPPPTAAPPALLKRLPPGFMLPVLALNVEDHYVRVYNAQGSEMLLMRLSDAIAEMAAQRGLQVHRSWWVADEAVTGAMRLGRNITLTLSNGLNVPVSRANTPSVRARGWLENIAEQPD